MARWAISMNAFSRVRTIYMYIFICLCHLREYALYTLRKLRHSRGLGQLMGVARKECAVELYRPAERKLPVAK